jgi:hypothetical protein
MAEAISDTSPLVYLHRASIIDRSRILLADAVLPMVLALAGEQ